MINRLIEWSLRNRFLVACGVLLVIGWGLRSLSRTPVDAIPDLSENQVIVFADWAGRSPQEVEDQVTYPLSVNLQGLAGVKTVRANSMFGFSLITIIFEDRIDNYFARSRVLERLNYLGDLCVSVVQLRFSSSINRETKSHGKKELHSSQPSQNSSRATAETENRRPCEVRTR